MAHTYVCCHIHYVFSTKNREKLITPEIAERLWPYLGGIARDAKMKALAVGGVEDHAHLLIGLPSTLTIARGIQLIKGNSSKWLSQTFRGLRNFEWREGYGAFSIGVALIEQTIAYVRKQHEHHRTKTFQEEFLAFLKRHNIEYNKRYIWG